ncbi:MAG: SDR family oxidoreductase [Kiloniellales bacterium]|nr:SDR family oxidoreductase [Kiloniellales bacterium]
MSFKNKTAVVTGAGGGMGLNIARDLLAAGANVACIDLKDRPDGLDRGPGRALYLQGDLTNDAFVGAAIGRAFDETGRLDYLVNGAGVLWFDRDVSLVDIDLDVWDQVLQIDLKSMVHATRHAVPLMKKSGGGAMVHIASVQALRGDDKPQDAYQAAKAAIVSLSKSLAVQFAGDGIRSNALCPGGTVSPMQARWEEDPAKKAAAAGGVPLGRLGTTQDMADATLFLLSDKASFITGIELVVDGGRLALP